MLSKLSLNCQNCDKGRRGVTLLRAKNASDVDEQISTDIYDDSRGSNNDVMVIPGSRTDQVEVR